MRGFNTPLKKEGNQMDEFKKARMKQSGIEPLGARIKSGKVSSEIPVELFVNGPKHFDCLVDKWAKKEILTILGSSGIGKTEVVLYFLKEIIKNNPSGICCFVSLEMSEQKIAQRFCAMVENEPEEVQESIMNRFYVITNFDEEGRCKALGTEGILKELENHQDVLGEDLLCFAIDHLHIIEPQPKQDVNKIAQEIKNIASSTNSLGILLSQVPKGKAQKGDVPLEADAAFNCSQLKWISSFIVQVHRPLIRVEQNMKDSNNIMCWSYVKIREQHADDEVRVGQNKLLSYSLSERKFEELQPQEAAMFSLNYEKVLEARKIEENDSCHIYDTSYKKIKEDGTEEVVELVCDIEESFNEKWKDKKKEERSIRRESKRVSQGFTTSSY